MLFANQLFKVYFKMSQLHLMKPLIRAIESSPFKNKFSIGQQVTYKYYAGLKAMMDEDYKSGTKSSFMVVEYVLYFNFLLLFQLTSTLRLLLKDVRRHRRRINNIF